MTAIESFTSKTKFLFVLQPKVKLSDCFRRSGLFRIQLFSTDQNQELTVCQHIHVKKWGYQAQSRESEFKIDMDLLVLQNLRSNDLHTHLGNLKNRPPFHLQPHTSSLSPLQLSRDRNLQLIIELL